jgi:GT2 family glycosyltransferase
LKGKGVLGKSDSTKPHVSVMVHNFKGLKKLENCLISLNKASYPNMKIVVVDALTDGIEEWMKSNFKNVDLLHFDEDYGIPFRRNCGLRKVSKNSKYIFFMDEDVTVSENWLSELVSVMEKNPKIGAVQPLMLNSEHRNVVDNGGCYIDFLGFPHRERKDLRTQKRLVNVSYAETASVLVRRELLNLFPNPREPFDSDYLVHWYDIDLSWKILLLGYDVVMDPFAVVYHERRLSAGASRLPYKNILINTRNRLVTMIKNYSLLNLARFLPAFLLLESGKAVILLIYRPVHAIATLRGIIWVFRNLKSVLKKRTSVQFFRRVPDSLVLKSFLHPNLMRLVNDYKLNYLLSA